MAEHGKNVFTDADADADAYADANAGTENVSIRVVD